MTSPYVNDALKMAIRILVSELNYDDALAIMRSTCLHLEKLSPQPVPELGAFRKWISEDGMKGPDTWPEEIG